MLMPFSSYPTLPILSFYTILFLSLSISYHTLFSLLLSFLSPLDGSSSFLVQKNIHIERDKIQLLVCLLFFQLQLIVSLEKARKMSIILDELLSMSVKRKSAPNSHRQRVYSTATLKLSELLYGLKSIRAYHRRHFYDPWFIVIYV